MKNHSVNIGNALQETINKAKELTEEYRVMIAQEYGDNPKPEKVKKIFTKGLKKLRNKNDNLKRQVIVNQAQIDALLEVYK